MSPSSQPPEPWKWEIGARRWKFRISLALDGNLWFDHDDPDIYAHHLITLMVYTKKSLPGQVVLNLSFFVLNMRLLINASSPPAHHRQ